VKPCFGFAIVTIGNYTPWGYSGEWTPERLCRRFVVVTEHRTTVFVAGATGRFGEITDLLLERGHDVRAMTREPDSPSAQRLRSLGAEIVTADFDDASSLAAAARGAGAAFASGTAHHVGPEGEARHGANLAEAIAAAEVPHLVFVSGDGAAPDSPLPLFRVKWEVEERIRSLCVPHTILAPTYLMENLFDPWNSSALRAGVLPSPIPVDQPLQQAAAADLLALAVLAIEDPSRFAGHRIQVASDELTAEEAAEMISSLIPRHLEARQAPADALPPGVRFLFGWLESTGHRVDLDALHSEYPELRWHGYGGWAGEHLDRFRELCPHPEPVAG
jgi:uncharacterized protein YbjT (DUF2867 family)